MTETDDLIAQLKGERGTALQGAQCYKAQRDLAWAEIDRLKAEIAHDNELIDNLQHRLNHPEDFKEGS